VDVGDIEKLRAVSTPDVASDGSFAVFATTRPHLGANTDVGQIWRVDVPGGTARPLTRGTADRQPAISPDGTQVAFLRKSRVGTAQIHVVEAHGGEPVAATEAPLGVQEFTWSPRGDLLAYVARVPEIGRYGTDDTASRSEAPRRITSVRWKADALGYLIDRPAHVFLVESPDLAAEPRYSLARGHAGVESPTVGRGRGTCQLTTGQNSHTGARFNLDGSEVYCLVETLEPDRRDLRTQVLALAVDGSGSREILTAAHNLAVSSICVAPSGALILLAHSTGTDGSADVAPPVGLWLMGADGPIRMSDPSTLDAGEHGTQVTAGNNAILVQHRTHGRLHLVALHTDGTVHERLGGDVEVISHASSGHWTVAAVATSTSPADLVLADPDGPRTLISFAHELQATGLSAPHEATITGRGGHPVHGWVHVPEGPGPHPVVLTIHGGPHSSYTVRVSDERQVLVRAGYAVVYCNPRGSAG
jgi:dipeptidyl aminopeptidase/acylaminoacyl peptidase